MRHMNARNVLCLAALAAAGLSTVGCASSSSASRTGTQPGRIVYQPSYDTSHSSQTLVAGDSLGRAMFEQGAVIASRAHAELRYAGVVE